MSKTLKKPAKSKSQNKSAQITALLRRNSGATVAELAKAIGWQRHSVHGFMSGTLKKKQGLEITSSRQENKDRRYRIAAGAQ
jgi:Protein of unknown function (DUF3489)